ncbi:MAG: DnaD domain protein [Clostridia bacterium]|nr:DnaD domain protein [Clostridia bacterium]
MNWNYGNAVLTLPASVLSNSDATAEQFRILLWLASDLTLSKKPAQLAKLADCTQKEIKAALAFWEANGVLISDGSMVATVAKPLDKSATDHFPKPPKKPLQRADELPKYTISELNDFLEKRENIRTLVDEAQQLLGKMFNPNDLNILIGLLDYLCLSEESILILIAYCQRIDKKSMRYVEILAHAMVAKNLTDPADLEEEIKFLETIKHFEKKVRQLFGIGNREFITKEKNFLRAWVEFGYGIDVVTKAYEMTVNATNEPSMPYANSIIERWHANGLHTLEEIERAEAEQKEKKANKKDGKPVGTVLGNSFDTDDFFEAAMRRSFANSDGNN